MNTEDSMFERKIRKVLDRGMDDLAPEVLGRLHAARQKALERQKVAIGGLQFASHFATFGLPAYARTLVAAFALLTGVILTYYWNSMEQAAENAEVDSALLSDELPPAAYLDKGFQTWLERSSPSSQ